MIIRSGRKNYSVWAFDVESHNDEETIKKRETSIWLYSFINDESKLEESSFGYTIEEWLDRLEKMTSGKRKNANETRPCKNLLIYIFNLSFEWSFIFPKLLDRGFTWVPRIEAKHENVFTNVSTRSASSVWSATLKFGKNHGIVEMRDLCKIFPGSLRSLAKSFGLPTQKGEIDYMLNRLHGHVVTPEEKEYCFKDTKIVMDILQKMKERNDRHFWKALSAGSYSMMTLIDQTFKDRTHKPMKAFRKRFPILGKEESDFIRKSVAGGITYSPSGWQFKVIDREIYHIDAKQMHPSSAYLNVFPYGKGTHFDGNEKPTDHVYICCQHIRVSYSSVKLHSVIKLIGLSFVDGYDLWLWDFEIELMKECYVDLEIEYIDGYAYRCALLPWRNYYKENFEKREKAKKEKDDFNILYYKLLNNSSYGKLLERPHDVYLENVIDGEGIITSIEHEVPEKEKKEHAKYEYLPVGSAIPARSRVALIRLALRFGWQNIVYFDTDSIFFIKTKETTRILQMMKGAGMFTPKLGNWGEEPLITKAQFTAPKRYKIMEGDEFVYHVAGFNDFSNKGFDDLDLESAVYDVKMAFRCKGGTIIAMKPKRIEVQEKYKDIYKANKGK